MERKQSRRFWLPKDSKLRLVGVSVTSDRVVVEAEGAASACCPACGRRSRARHSRYWRTLRDLPAQARAVTLRVRVSRWRCRNTGCATSIFADRLIGVSAPRVQHTQRFRAVVHFVGHALGGRGGERLLSRLGLAVSDDTILRLLKGGVPTPSEALRVVGIDDWAWQKGQHHYGTILVDLERRQVADVLGSRTADAVSTWLAARPSITVISRDRHGPYAQGVRRGAPQATEVADRFHLVLNLRGAVQQELSRLRHCLVVPSGRRPVTRSSALAWPTPPRRPSAVVQQEQQIARARRALKLERFRLVKRLQAAGRPGAAIIRETGIGRASVRKWLRLSELPPRQRMAPRPGMPAFYESYLARRWAEGCQSVTELMAEIQPLGYVGAYAGLAKFLAPWREPAPARHAIDERDTVPVVQPVRHISPQVAAALLAQPRPLLSVRQAETVDTLKEQCPGFTTMRRLVLSFRTVLRHGHVSTLHRWLARATATNIDALQRFVRTLQQDLGAVEGAVTESWSNGPVEGHINRLKTLRRQMYGRAGVDLLRARVLPLPPLSLS